MKDSLLLEFDLTSNTLNFTKHLSDNTIQFYIYVNKQINNEYFTHIVIDVNQNYKWEIDIFKKNISLQKLQTLVTIIICKWENLIMDTNSSDDYIFSTAILSESCLKVFKNIKYNILLTTMYKDKKQILKYRKRFFRYFLSPSFFIFPVTIFNDIDATKDKRCPIPMKFSA